MGSPHHAGPVVTPVQIRFSDVDMAGHVHNAVHLQWFELARIGLFRTFVPADHDWLEQGVIIARNEIDYRIPVLLTDPIQVACWCAGIGGSSIDLRYAVQRAGDHPATCALGRSVLVCYDFSAGSKIPVPDAWRTPLERLRMTDDAPGA
jgi:acyl-CoA thioester hydrolase